jgi:hypothetical protein
VEAWESIFSKSFIADFPSQNCELRTPHRSASYVRFRANLRKSLLRKEVSYVSYVSYGFLYPLYTQGNTS